MQFVQQQPGWQQPPMQQSQQQQYQQQNQQPYQQQMPPHQPYQQPMQRPGMHYQQQYGYQWQPPQKKSSSTGIILLTVLIVVLFAVGAVGILSKGTFFIPSRSEPPASTPVAEPGETSEEPDEEAPEETMIQVDASSLISEYMQDTESADATYKGEQIEVTGLVEYIGVEGEEEAEIPYVYLGGNSQSELFLVKCYFTIDEKSVVDALEILGSITIQGTCDGYEDDVIVKDCSIQ
jgi:hypothetical protein